MASFLIFTPPGTAGSGTDKDHAATRFVRDGFSLAAFLVPGFWLLAKRQWLAGIAALVMQGIAGAVPDHSLTGMLAGFAIGLSVCLLVGLEGTNLVMRSLNAKGWTQAGLVVADRRSDAEAIYFSQFEDAAPQIRPAIAMPPSGHASPRGGPALGLLGFDGGQR